MQSAPGPFVSGAAVAGLWFVTSDYCTGQGSARGRAFSRVGPVLQHHGLRFFDGFGAPPIVSNVSRSIALLAKLQHQVDQQKAAEQSAAVLQIETHCLAGEGYEGERARVSLEGNQAQVYDVHKTSEGALRVVDRPLSTERNLQPGERYAFVQYTPAVGEYISARYLTDRDDYLRDYMNLGAMQVEELLNDSQVQVSLKRPSAVRSALYFRCDADVLPKRLDSLLQAYMAGSFV